MLDIIKHDVAMATFSLRQPYLNPDIVLDIALCVYISMYMGRVHLHRIDWMLLTGNIISLFCPACKHIDKSHVFDFDGHLLGKTCITNDPHNIYFIFLLL